MIANLEHSPSRTMRRNRKPSSTEPSKFGPQSGALGFLDDGDGAVIYLDGKEVGRIRLENRSRYYEIGYDDGFRSEVFVIQLRMRMFHCENKSRWVELRETGISLPNAKEIVRRLWQKIITTVK